MSLLFLYSSLALDGLLEVIGVKLDESSVETRRYPSGIKLSTALLHSGLEGDILLIAVFHFSLLSDLTYRYFPASVTVSGEDGGFSTS